MMMRWWLAISTIIHAASLSAQSARIARPMVREKKAIHRHIPCLLLACFKPIWKVAKTLAMNPVFMLAVMADDV